jgi:hypothetical protein
MFPLLLLQGKCDVKQIVFHLEVFQRNPRDFRPTLTRQTQQRKNSQSPQPEILIFNGVSLFQCFAKLVIIYNGLSVFSETAVSHASHSNLTHPIWLIGSKKRGVVRETSPLLGGLKQIGQFFIK